MISPLGLGETVHIDGLVGRRVCMKDVVSINRCKEYNAIAHKKTCEVGYA